MTPMEKRKLIEEQIDVLIAALDFFDDDPDLEDNGDAEPSLAGPPKYIGGRLEYDLENDESDYEPDIGWSEQIDQADVNRCWGVEGDRSDFEASGDEADTTFAEDEFQRGAA